MILASPSNRLGREECKSLVTIATGLPGAWNSRPLEPVTVFSTPNVINLRGWDKQVTSQPYILY